MTNKTLQDLQDEVLLMKQYMDILDLLQFGNLILFMQYGLGLLEAGSTRSKNVNNVLFKNFLNSLVVGLLYWTIGYALAYGKGNEFIGWTRLWAFNSVSNLDLARWYFQFALAAATATIASGALAERCKFVAYPIYSCCLTGIIYPIVTHWVWSEEGWLSKGDYYTIDGKNVTIHYKDFAGSGPVHVLGGVCAFLGALILGPRIGRFHSSTEGRTTPPRRGYSVTLVVLGSFILYVGFLGINAGSTAEDQAAKSIIVANTFLSGISAALVSLIIHRMIDWHSWNLLHVINSSLAGMVAICAGCNVVRQSDAFCIGAIGGIVYRITSKAVLKLKVDDPVNAVAVHFGGGCWGVISVAFFHSNEGIFAAGDKKSGYFLAWQLIGLASIIVWTGGLSCIVFLLLKLAGILRVSEEIEEKGFKNGESMLSNSANFESMKVIDMLGAEDSKGSLNPMRKALLEDDDSDTEDDLP